MEINALVEDSDIKMEFIKSYQSTMDDEVKISEKNIMESSGMVKCHGLTSNFRLSVDEDEETNANVQVPNTTKSKKEFQEWNNDYQIKVKKISELESALEKSEATSKASNQELLKFKRAYMKLKSENVKAKKNVESAEITKLKSLKKELSNAQNELKVANAKVSNLEILCEKREQDQKRLTKKFKKSQKQFFKWRKALKTKKQDRTNIHKLQINNCKIRLRKSLEQVANLKICENIKICRC